MDANGNLIVGTDPSGLILRVTPAGEGFVLYQAPKREITAVAVAPDGTIYAAGVGNKKPLVSPPPPPLLRCLLLAPRMPAGAVPRPAPSDAAAAAPAVTGGSEIYRIQADGYPRRSGAIRRTGLRAGLRSHGRVIAATGNHGDIYRLESDQSVHAVVELASTQVTGFCAAPDGTHLRGHGKYRQNIFHRAGTGAVRRTYESDVFDAGAFTYWGRLSISPKRTRRHVRDAQRQSEPSPAELESLGRNSTRAESLRLRLVSSNIALTLSGSGEIYRGGRRLSEKNVAPVIEEVEITPENYKFPPPLPPSLR